MRRDDDPDETEARPHEGGPADPAAPEPGAGSPSGLIVGPDELSRVLDRESPQPDRRGPRAAVAAVFRRGTLGTELLFIQRATNERDPWSGHMAFPGGRIDPGDIDSHAAAERETLEEVGLDLAGARRLGSLSTRDGGRARNNLIAVHAHGYWLDGAQPRLTRNYEIADVLWVPLAVLADPNRHIDYYYPLSDSHWPGVQLDNPRQVVWGLTLRFLADLFDRLDTRFIAVPPG